MGILAFIVLMLAFPNRVSAGETPLVLLDRIPLPDVSGRIDHMAADPVTGRLFVAALGNNSLEIVDLHKKERVGRIPQLREPQGVAFLADANRLVVANGGDGTCLVYDGTTLERLAGLDFGEDADNLRYDAAPRTLFVGYGKGAIGIVDAGLHRVGHIQLPGHPESFALSRDGSRLFVNVPAAHEIVVADVERRQQVATWKLEKARKNFPMALDESSHLLLVGVREPSRLLGFDTQTGRITLTVPIDGDPDDIFIDSERQLVYVSCGAGFLDVLGRIGAKSLDVMKKIPTAAGARTSLFVPELRRLFVAVPMHDGVGAEIRIFGVQSAR